MKTVPAQPGDELYIDLGQYGLLVKVDASGRWYDVEYIINHNGKLYRYPADMVVRRFVDNKECYNQKADTVRIWRH